MRFVGLKDTAKQQNAESKKPVAKQPQKGGGADGK